MTWTKFGQEFSNECAEKRLTDAEFRTHVEAIMYIYSVEAMGLSLQKDLVRRWAGSDHYPQAIEGLVRKGLWKEFDDGYAVLHHGDVVRQSLAFQTDKREKDKQRKRKQRARDAAQDSPNVTQDVTRDVVETQSVSHTGSQHLRGGEYVDEDGVVFTPPPVVADQAPPTFPDASVGSAERSSDWDDWKGGKPWVDPMKEAS